MKFIEYVKIEEFKHLIILHLKKLGLSELIEVMNDEDLNKLITVMFITGQELRAKDTDEQRLDFLISYVIGLWAKLIVDYGAGVEDL